MEFENQIWSGGKLAAIRTYERCISLLVEVLASADVEFKPSGSGQRERFESVRRELATRLREKDKKDVLWHAAEDLGIYISEKDPEDPDSIVQAAVDVAQTSKAEMLDDLSPNVIKAALYEVLDTFCADESVVVSGREFFRRSLDVLKREDRTMRRINVVRNNYWRLFQYVLEIVDEDGRIRPHGVGKRLETFKLRIAP